jgi:hypothetical protein
MSQPPHIKAWQPADITPLPPLAMLHSCSSCTRSSSGACTAACSHLGHISELCCADTDPWLHTRILQMVAQRSLAVYVQTRDSLVQTMYTRSKSPTQLHAYIHVQHSTCVMRHASCWSTDGFMLPADTRQGAFHNRPWHTPTCQRRMPTRSCIAYQSPCTGE